MNNKKRESWCCVTDSNRHSSGYEPGVLPLHKHNKKDILHRRKESETTMQDTERTICLWGESAGKATNPTGKAIVEGNREDSLRISYTTKHYKIKFPSQTTTIYCVFS